MTTPFEVLARLRHDVRVLKLPPLARLALYHLASEEGAIHTADLTTAEALDLLERGAGESAGRALDLGVIEHLNTVLRLVFTTPDGGSGVRCEPSSPAPTPRPRVAAKTTTEPAPRATSVARCKSPADVLRNARWYFKRRSRAPWKDVPADVTFEAWLASPEGVAWQVARGLDLPTSATVTAPPEGVAGVAEAPAPTVAEDAPAPLPTVAATVATATAATVEGVADRCETVAATALQTVAEVRNGVAATVGNGVAGSPSLTLSPSEKTEKKDQTNQTSDAREGGVVGLVASPATAATATVATPRNGNGGNASQRPPVATPRNGNAPLTAVEFNDLARKTLGTRFEPLRLEDFEALDFLIGMVSERWGEANNETVTVAHWRAFIAWLDKGGDTGQGGLSWWSKGSPYLSFFVKGSNLHRYFDMAMSWWPARRKHLDAVKRKAEADARRASEPPAAPASPVLSPAELAAQARAAAQSFRDLNTAHKPAPLTYRGAPR